MGQCVRIIEYLYESDKHILLHGYVIHLSFQKVLLNHQKVIYQSPNETEEEGQEVYLSLLLSAGGFIRADVIFAKCYIWMRQSLHSGCSSLCHQLNMCNL